MIWVYPKLLSVKLVWLIDQTETTTGQTILEENLDARYDRAIASKSGRQLSRKSAENL